MKARKEKEKLSMETYIDFVLSRKQLDLKVDFLNQIIAMHGFKRINKAPKSMLVNAVKSLDVMDPSRSTLNENIGPCASIHLNSILAGLNELCWQECCVTSVDVFNNTEVPQTSNASASMPWCHGFENSEIPMKWLTKRKRSQPIELAVRTTMPEFYSSLVNNLLRLVKP